MKVVFLCSTSGSVIKRYFKDFNMLNNVEIVSDRYCDAIEYAISEQIESRVFETKSGLEFSDRLFEVYKGDENILFISFYTRLLGGRFIKENEGRLINFHPSILPACSGQDGFGDTIASGAMFVGSTVHLIDEGMDTGLPIIQAACPRDTSLDISSLRHRVFLQQVVSLAQIIEWYTKGKVKIGNCQLQIEGVKYLLGEFSPNLDGEYQQYFSEAIMCH